MSLTSILGSKEGHKIMSLLFEKPVMNVKEDVTAYVVPKNNPYLVGTCFDYLLRFFIERINNRDIVISCGDVWVARNVLDLKMPKEIRVKIEKRFKEVNINYNKYLDDGVITSGLMDSIIFLGKVETVWRSGYVENLNESLFDYDEGVAKNLLFLYNILKLEKISDNFVGKCQVVLNPTFGKGSELVGGADADLIVDDTLIDIKTIKSLDFERDIFNQLIGYYALYVYNKKWVDPSYLVRPEIKSLGVYFSRFGVFVKFDIKDIKGIKNLPKFIKFLEERDLDE